MKRFIALAMILLLSTPSIALAADYGSFTPPDGPSSESVLMNSFAGMVDPNTVALTDENTSYAKGEYKAVDYNIIPKERLEDNVIDYDELGSLVYFNNLTVNQITDALNKTKADYEYIRDYLRDEKYWTKDEYKDAKEVGNTKSYINNYTLYKIYESGAKSYSDVVKKLDKYSTQKSRIGVERQFTKGAQSLFIAYKSVDIQLDTLYQLRDMYRSTLSNLEENRKVGFTVDSTVDKIKSTLEASEINIATLEETRDKLKNSLCSLLGLDPALYEIGEINYDNFNYYNNIYYDRDLYFAVNNSQSLNTIRQTKVDSSYAMEIKGKQEDEGEDDTVVAFKKLYDTVENEKVAYEISLKSMNTAQLAWEKALQQKELGMLTDVELEQKKLAYIQAQVNVRSAELAYYQAMVNYDWATRGYM